MSVLEKIVFASNNMGKFREFRKSFRDLKIQLIPQSEFGVKGAPEPYPTFLENALAKARFASTATCLPALADDSGICVDVLQGLPGVRSARFGGEGSTDLDNNRLLLKRMYGKENRVAVFYCVVALIRGTDDPLPMLGFGSWEGVIADKISKLGGFGYDPIFFDGKLGKLASNLEIEEKNAVSHRGQAIRQITSVIKDERNSK